MSKYNKYIEACVMWILYDRRLHRLVFAGNKTSRGMGPKCIYKVIARHARIVWLDNRQWWRLRHDDLTFKMAVRFSQTIHTCLVVAFRTQDSTHFAPAKLCLRRDVFSARAIFSWIWLYFPRKVHFLLHDSLVSALAVIFEFCKVSNWPATRLR